ncbi:hypothetical protein [Ensifer soli]|uniref:hypothetical protein n=1 Tax=Ciceribacter sp. sgz301302 TaxID=3342379 RepID=UPI0035B79EF7
MRRTLFFLILAATANAAAAAMPPPGAGGARSAALDGSAADEAHELFDEPFCIVEEVSTRDRQGARRLTAVEICV